jgi:hypothetical protein
VPQKLKDNLSLIEYILSSANQFGLSSEQIARLNTSYWRNFSSKSPIETEIGLDGLLTEGQSSRILQNVIDFNIALGKKHQFSDDDVQNKINETISAQMKDKSLIEIQLASNVSEKLIGWAKIFAYIVGIPIAIVLVILSILGISSYNDLHNESVRISSIIKSAEDDLKSKSTEIDNIVADYKALNKKTDSLQRDVNSLIEQIFSGVTKFETGNKGPGFVSHIGQNAFYGSYGLNAFTTSRFVTDARFPWKDQFANLKPSTEEFDALWRKIAESDGDKFQEAQNNFVRKEFADKAVVAIASSPEGIDLSSRSKELQTLVWVLTLERGPPGTVDLVLSACRNLRAAGEFNPSGPEFDNLLTNAILAGLSANERETLHSIIHPLKN